MAGTLWGNEQDGQHGDMTRGEGLLELKYKHLKAGLAGM